MINAIKYAFAAVAGKGANLIIVFLLAHSLNTEDFAHYYYILNLVGIFMLISQLGLPVLLVREVAKAKDKPDRRKGVIVFSLMANGLSFAAIVLFLSLSNGLLPLSAYETLVLAIVIGLYSLSAISGSILAGLNKVYEGAWPDTMLRGLVLMATIGALALFAPQWLTLQSLLILLALSHAATVITLCVMLWTSRAEIAPPDRPQIQHRAWLKSTIILGGASIATLLNSRVDILMLELLCSVDALATYAFSLQFVIFFTFPYVVVGSFLLPRLSETLLSDRARAHADFGLSTTAIVSITFAVSAFIIGFTFFGWNLLVPTSFDGAKPVIILFALFYFANTLLGPVAIYMNADNGEVPVFIVSLISGIFNVGLNLVLIPMLAEKGAALATMLSMSVMNVILFALIVRRFGPSTIMTASNFAELAYRVRSRIDNS